NQNGALTARNVFATAVPNVRKNQYGYSVGGPIFKNRTFFFTTFEGLRQSGAPAQVYTVETSQFRDFVASKYPNSIAAYLLTHYQPAAYPTSGRDTAGFRSPVGRVDLFRESQRDAHLQPRQDQRVSRRRIAVERQPLGCDPPGCAEDQHYGH